MVGKELQVTSIITLFPPQNTRRARPLNCKLNCLLTYYFSMLCAATVMAKISNSTSNLVYGVSEDKKSDTSFKLMARIRKCYRICNQNDMGLHSLSLWTGTLYYNLYYKLIFIIATFYKHLKGLSSVTTMFYEI